MHIIHQPYSLEACLDIGILAVLDWTNGMAWNFRGCNSSWQKVEANFGSFSYSCWDLKVSVYKIYRHQHLEIWESYTMENLPRHMSVMSEKKKHSLSVKIRQRGRINPRQAILYRKSGILLSEKCIAQLQFEKTITRCCINLPNFLSHLSHQSFMANKQVGITLLGSNASCTLAQVQLAKRRG